MSLRKLFTVLPGPSGIGLAVALAISSWTISSGFAQSAVNGAFGSRNLGGTISAGTGNFGGGGAFGGGAGSGGAGGAAAGMGASGQAGLIQGSERFIRGNQSGNFIGADTADVNGFVGAVQAGNTGPGGGRGGAGAAGGRGAQGGFGQAGGFGGQGGRGGQANGQFGGRGGGLGAAGSRTVFRTQLTLGFQPPTVDVPAVTNRIQTRVTRIRGMDRYSQLGQIQVASQGATVILTGTVPDADRRMLLEKLAMLEPGVRAVDNQLEVRPQE